MVQRMKRGMAVVLFAVTAMGAHAQVSWRRAYGALADDRGMAVRAVNEDLIVAVGRTGSFGEGGGDIYLMAADGNGIPLWSRTIGGPEVEGPHDLRVCANGDLVIAGLVAGAGGYDGLLVRTDADGELLWTRTFGGDDWDFLYDVKELGDGGFLLTGETFSQGEPGGNAWLLRTDAQGELLWQRTFGGSGAHEGRAAVVAPDGNYVMAGSLLTPDRDRDILVVKVDTEGNELWTRIHGGDSLDVARDIILAPGGGYSIVGDTRSFSIWEEGYQLKLFDDGNLHWQFHWGGVADRSFSEHRALADGEYMIAGHTEGFGGGKKDMILQRMTINGGYIYGNTFGGVEDDMAAAMDLIGTGFLIGGSTLSYGSGGSDLFLVRTNADGLTASEAVQVSFDPLSVREQAAEGPALALYPNPAHGEVHFGTAGSAERVVLRDLSGRVVEVHRLVPGSTSFTSRLADGVYLVEVHVQGGAVALGRIQLLNP